jgi:hypothetical protein
MHYLELLEERRLWRTQTVNQTRTAPASRNNRTILIVFQVKGDRLAHKALNFSTIVANSNAARQIIGIGTPAQGAVLVNYPLPIDHPVLDSRIVLCLLFRLHHPTISIHLFNDVSNLRAVVPSSTTAHLHAVYTQ